MGVYARFRHKAVLGPAFTPGSSSRPALVVNPLQRAPEVTGQEPRERG